MRRESPHFVCLQPGDKKRYVGAKFGDCGVRRANTNIDCNIGHISPHQTKYNLSSRSNSNIQSYFCGLKHPNFLTSV